MLLAVSFSALLWVGGEIHRVMPPIPTAVVTQHGETILTRADIEKGRQVWQSIGGQQLGSIWGHGSYVAPDWTADWLHREATAWLDIESLRQNAVPYSGLGESSKLARDAAAAATACEHIRCADRQHRRVGRSRGRDGSSVARTTRRCSATIRQLHSLRKAYAMKEGTVIDADNAHRADARSSGGRHGRPSPNRPGKHISYTNNWPHDPLVGNTPPSHCCCGRCSACCSSSPASRCSAGTMRGSATRRRRRCRQAIRSR